MESTDQSQGAIVEQIERKMRMRFKVFQRRMNEEINAMIELNIGVLRELDLKPMSRSPPVAVAPPKRLIVEEDSESEENDSDFEYDPRFDQSSGEESDTDTVTHIAERIELVETEEKPVPVPEIVPDVSYAESLGVDALPVTEPNPATPLPTNSSAKELTELKDVVEKSHIRSTDLVNAPMGDRYSDMFKSETPKDAICMMFDDAGIWDTTIQKIFTTERLVDDRVTAEKLISEYTKGGPGDLNHLSTTCNIHGKEFNGTYKDPQNTCFTCIFDKKFAWGIKSQDCMFYVYMDPIKIDVDDFTGFIVDIGGSPKGVAQCYRQIRQKLCRAGCSEGGLVVYDPLATGMIRVYIKTDDLKISVQDREYSEELDCTYFMGANGRRYLQADKRSPWRPRLTPSQQKKHDKKVANEQKRSETEKNKVDEDVKVEEEAVTVEEKIVPPVTPTPKAPKVKKTDGEVASSSKASASKAKTKLVDVIETMTPIAEAAEPKVSSTPPPPPPQPEIPVAQTKSSKKKEKKNKKVKNAEKGINGLNNTDADIVKKEKVPVNDKPHYKEKPMWQQFHAKAKLANVKHAELVANDLFDEALSFLTDGGVEIGKYLGIVNKATDVIRKYASMRTIIECYSCGMNSGFRNFYSVFKSDEKLGAHYKFDAKHAIEVYGNECVFWWNPMWDDASLTAEMDNLKIILEHVITNNSDVFIMLPLWAKDDHEIMKMVGSSNGFFAKARMAFRHPLTGDNVNVQCYAVHIGCNDSKVLADVIAASKGTIEGNITTVASWMEPTVRTVTLAHVKSVLRTPSGTTIRLGTADDLAAAISPDYNKKLHLYQQIVGKKFDFPDDKVSAFVITSKNKIALKPIMPVHFSVFVLTESSDSFLCFVMESKSGINLARILEAADAPAPNEIRVVPAKQQPPVRRENQRPGRGGKNGSGRGRAK